MERDEELKEAYLKQPKCAWWVLVFSSKSERDHIFEQMFGHGLLGAVGQLPIARTSEDRSAVATAVCCKAREAKDRYVVDPRPQVDGHLPFDETWRLQQ